MRISSDHIIKQSLNAAKKLNEAIPRISPLDYLLSSPGPKPLVSKPKPKGLGLTLKSYGPHSITFKHEGGVPQQNPERKT